MKKGARAFARARNVGESVWCSEPVLFQQAARRGEELVEQRESTQVSIVSVNSTDTSRRLPGARLVEGRRRASLSLWACASAALLSGSMAWATQDTAEGRFVVNVVGGPPLIGRLVDVRDEGRSVVFEVQGATRSVPFEELVELTRFVPPARSSDGEASVPQRRRPPPGSFLVLAGGDRIYGTLTKASEDVASVESPEFGSIEVPLEAVQVAVLLAPDDRAARHGLLERLEAHREANDVVLLDNGDTFLGNLLGLDGTKLTLETSSGKVDVARGTVAAIAMNRELAAAPVLDGLHAVVQLQDGSRVTVRAPRLREGKLEFPTAFGSALAIEPSQLLSLQVLGGRVQYVSDLKPAAYRHTPYVGLGWPWRRDLSVGGQPLLLGGRRHAKGLGVHSRCELTYELEGGFRRFEATVGIDDETAGSGSVVFRVLVDGEQRFASPIVRGGDAPIELMPIDVVDAQQLTLIVEFADHGDVQDHADWADARLVK